MPILRLSRKRYKVQGCEQSEEMKKDKDKRFKTGKRVSIYKTAFFNGKAKTITKVDDVEPELSMSRQEILNTIDKMGFRRFGMGH